MTYTKEQGKQKIGELIVRFRTNIDAYKRSTYKEAQVRREFIDPFFEALGWDVSNEQGDPEHSKEVVLEDTIKVGHSTRAPDYSFRIGGQRKFFVEAKKPAVNIKENVSPSYQLRRYAWSAKLPLSILTDFEEFSVFDCRFKPNQKDKTNVHRIKYYTFEDYLDMFDEIYDLFSKGAVLKGSFDRHTQSTKSKKGTTEVDSEFLKEIESWRELLAKNIALRNPDVSIYELNYAVQKLLDRIIFLRICEDRGIEQSGQLQTKVEGGNVYMHLLNHFKVAQSNYNSGIFDFDADKITSSLTIDDKVLKTIILDLYPPKSPYEFSVFGVEILGNVYEQFLGKVIRLTAGHQAKVETKPEVKKAGGVYYTPQYIVEYIVKNTVGKLIAGKTPEEIAAIKILDPACGSGSFLIGAYTYLLRYHLNWYVSNEPKKHKKAVFRVRENEWYLTTAEKKRILLDNVFGVDIDPQAVEVTKLSLLLKVLENESRESIDQQVKLGLEGVLPNLVDNIKCGNSLIGPDFYDTQQATLFDEAEMRRVNVFDWDDEVKGFGGIMKRGGFDCVIGNPPYVRIQTTGRQGQGVEYYNRVYMSAVGNYDIYCLFVEKGASLLKQKGKLGYILPHRFFKTNYGEGLRKFISSRKTIERIIDFDGYMVFSNASINTCIMILDASQNDKFLYVQAKFIRKHSNEVANLIDEIGDNGYFDNEIRSGIITSSVLQQPPWVFIWPVEKTVWQKLDSVSLRLEDLTDRIFQGLKTGSDKIYIFDFVREERNGLLVRCGVNGKNYELERNILKPLIKGGQMKRYHIGKANKLILFPYENGKLMTSERLTKDFPKTWEYLLTHKSYLENRESGKMKGQQWYAYTRSQALDTMWMSKIITPEYYAYASYCLDLKGDFYFCGGGAGGYAIVVKKEYNSRYLLGLLNSKLLDWYLHKISIRAYQTAYMYTKKYIAQLPIRTIDFSNPSEKAQHDKLVALVDNMLELQKKYHDVRMEQDKELYERQIRIVDAQIDGLVYDLYGLTEVEIRIVEKK